jgi:hypothetical protein
MATATTLNSSGMPTARIPEMTAFHFVGNSEAVTRGINRGLKKPTTADKEAVPAAGRIDRLSWWSIKIQIVFSF